MKGPIGAILLGQAALTVGASILNGMEVRRRHSLFDGFNGFAQRMMVLTSACFPFMAHLDFGFDLPLSIAMSATALSWVAVMRLRQALHKERGIYS